MRYLKFLLCIALVVSGVEGRGQIYIDSYKFAAAGGGLLLDDYPTAAGAYSLRKLRTEYTGDCIIVRRSSGSPALDTIGFVDNYLDTATLKTFCSGVNCFVRTWLDQSGNGRNATNTTDARQPRIVNAGTLEKDNGKVALYYDGSTDLRTDTFSLGQTAYSTFVVSNVDDLNVTGRAIFSIMPNADNNNGWLHILYRSDLTNNFRFLYSSNGTGGNQLIQVASSTYPTTQALTSAIVPLTTGNIKSYVNNVEQDSDPTFTATLNTMYFFLGNYFTKTNESNEHMGYIQEIVVYPSNQDANRVAIHTNINSFYSIY